MSIHLRQNPDVPDSDSCSASLKECRRADIEAGGELEERFHESSPSGWRSGTPGKASRSGSCEALSRLSWSPSCAVWPSTFRSAGRSRASSLGVEPLSPAALLGAVATVAGVALAVAGLAVWSVLRRISLDLLKTQGGQRRL